MRCRTCNYALWNLTTRQCPECGAAFKPSEFEFTPGSVRFHCPHCNKAYYGTDDRGHLVPRGFNCVGCGRGIEMDEMALSPAQGLAEEQTVPIELPWTTRAKNGTIGSFFKTCWWAMARPTDLGRSVPIVGGAAAAWWFMLIVQFVSWTLLVSSFLVVIALPMALVPARGGMGGPAGMMVTGFGISLFVLVGFIVVILSPLWALTAHLILRSTGQTRGTMGVTFCSICYSSGANLPTGVPFIGYLFGPIWWLVSATMTVKESQRVSGGRAALAVLPLPIFMALLLIGGYVALMSFTMTAVTRAQAAATAAQTAAQAQSQSAGDAVNVKLLVTAISTESSKNSAGMLPDPLDLVSKGIVPPKELISTASQTTPETWPISGVPLGELPLIPEESLRQLRYRLSQIQQPPDDAGEFRLGDVVFTYRGMNVRMPDPRVWLVIMWPDPKVNSIEDPNWVVWVGQADGATVQLTPATFDAALMQQNTLRESLGMKPLRHPRDVGK